jgi:hypothetical protein
VPVLFRYPNSSKSEHAEANTQNMDLQISKKNKKMDAVIGTAFVSII